MKESEEIATKRAGDDNRNGKFGYFGCTPFFLQWLNNPWVFLILVILAMIGNTAAVLGVLVTVMPHIEKRFNLSSFDAGLIAAANDVPAVIFGLFVSHYGHYSNKVRWIGIGGIITGIGLFIVTIPHYIIGNYNPPQAMNILCGTFLLGPLPPPAVNGSNPSPCDSGEIAERYHLAIIIIGQFISGIGTIPMFAFPPAIFRETLKMKHVPTCLALWQASVFVGPLIAFAYSERLLETWVDIDLPEGQDIDTLDPRWISSWWLGFLGPAGLCLLVGLITLGLPKHIKSQLSDNELAEIQKNDQNDQEKSLKEKLIEIPRILKELLTNWTFVFNCLAFNTSLMFAEGLAPFIAKILILRFGVEPTDVGETLNVAIVPPLILGVAFSIILLRIIKIEESGKKSALICFLIQFAGILPPMASLLTGCKNINLAGHVVPYGLRTPISGGFNLTKTYPAIPGYPLGSTCNAECKCGLSSAIPVCGTDGVTYLNPCFAGCKIPTLQKTFLNCSCIPSPDGYGGIGQIGFCDRDCKNWLVFLVLISLFSLATFTQLSPSKVVVMRAVKAEHLSFAFGLHYLSNKVLANIPGPILFGHVVDLNCDIWQKVCDKTGFCLIYDLDEMMEMLAIMTGSLTGIGLVMYFIMWLVYTEAETVPVKRELQINNPGYENDIEKNDSDTKL